MELSSAGPRLDRNLAVMSMRTVRVLHLLFRPVSVSQTVRQQGRSQNRQARPAVDSFSILRCPAGTAGVAWRDKKLCENLTCPILGSALSP